MVYLTRIQIIYFTTDSDTPPVHHLFAILFEVTHLNMASPSFIFGGNKPSANPTSNGFIFGTPSPNPAEDPIETWTRGNFKATYCNGGGKHTVPIDVEFFKQSLEKRRPEAVVEIGEAIKR
jgi:hypothetical protein